MRLLNYYEETIVDGPGLRFAFYFSGCKHACEGCHNKESWNPRAGKPITKEYFDFLVEKINANKYLDGITLSGGDPFYQPEELLDFLQKLRNRTKLPILVYTGYTFEELQESETMRHCLLYIDMLVDGRFEQAKRYPIKPFRGSWNQRLLRLKEGKVIDEL